MLWYFGGTQASTISHRDTYTQKHQTHRETLIKTFECAWCTCFCMWRFSFLIIHMYLDDGRLLRGFIKHTSDELHLVSEKMQFGVLQGISSPSFTALVGHHGKTLAVWTARPPVRPVLVKLRPCVPGHDTPL